MKLRQIIYAGFVPVLVGLNAACTGSPQPRQAEQPVDSGAKVCRLSIAIDEGLMWQVVVTDRKLITAIAEVPLASAQLDPDPLDYKGLARLILERDDGTKEYVWLFSPLGHFKKDGKCYVTDFSELKKVVMRVKESGIFEGW